MKILKILLQIKNYCMKLFIEIRILRTKLPRNKSMRQKNLSLENVNYADYNNCNVSFHFFINV